jgi:hypothetical protein
MNWNNVNHNGNVGFGGCIATVKARQGRIYPVTADLWKWEIREVETRKLLFVGTTRTENDAKLMAELHIHRPYTKNGIKPISFIRIIWLAVMAAACVLALAGLLGS